MTSPCAGCHLEQHGRERQAHLLPEDRQPYGKVSQLAHAFVTDEPGSPTYRQTRSQHRYPRSTDRVGMLFGPTRPAPDEVPGWIENMTRGNNIENPQRTALRSDRRRSFSWHSDGIGHKRASRSDSSFWREDPTVRRLPHRFDELPVQPKEPSAPVCDCASAQSTHRRA